MAGDGACIRASTAATIRDDGFACGEGGLDFGFAGGDCGVALFMWQVDRPRDMAEVIEKRGAGVIDQRLAGLLEGEKITEGNRGNHAAFVARERFDRRGSGGGGGRGMACAWRVETGSGARFESSFRECEKERVKN